MKANILVFILVCVAGAFCIWISGVKMFTTEAGMLSFLTFAAAALLSTIGNI